MDKFKNIGKKLERFVDGMLAGKVSATALLASLLGIIAIRGFEEHFLAYAPATVGEMLIANVHNFLFFANTFVLVWLALSFFLQKNPAKITTIILWALWLILLPPLIDMVKTGGDIFWSFYLLNSPAGLWQQFITIFGNLPSGIVYFGSKIVFLGAVCLSATIVYLKTKKIIKTCLSASMVYVILFFMGSSPSWIVFIYSFFHGKSVRGVTGVQIAQFFGSPTPIFGLDVNTLKYAFAYHLNILFYLALLILLAILFFVINREKFWAIINNARFPQIAYHAGLFSVGLGLGFLAYPHNMHLNFFEFLSVLALLASIWLAWLASVIVNDIYDLNIDAVSNSERPLQKEVFTLVEYRDLGLVFFALSILGALAIGLQFAMILLIYQIIAWFYSAKPYRLKRFPLVATFFSAMASVTVIFIGFSLFSGDDNIKLFPWRITLLMLTALTLSLPIKDFKDIAGDKADGILTIPVVFGMDTGRIIVASGIFISFMLSVFFLNERRLFWWALLCGTLAFLTLITKKIKPRQMFWWVLGITAIYAVVLMKIIFIR
ncbi:MAG: hypothetical protein UT50_C0003G0024 [Candidatus Moranbacteria bacterium GW2011_GWA2_39_41]|nr:MAG: hypothetical protein UT50_C0003G0024 [Candidatus Moranbacteria bacterium GW2011_GWA2_39_41]